MQTLGRAIPIYQIFHMIQHTKPLMNIIQHGMAYCLLLVMLSGCNEELARKYEAKPTALGRLNEIVFISDQSLLDSPIKDTTIFYFESSYPIMPTPEPMFDLRFFSLKDLEYEPLRKELRTYILLANLDDMESLATQMVRNDLGEERFKQAKAGSITSSVGRDKWAKNQILIYLFGNGMDDLAKTIKKSYSAVAKRINDHDRHQLASSVYAVKQENLGLTRQIQEKYGVELLIPGDFLVAIEDSKNDFLWLRKDTKDAILNMTISKLEYKGPEMLYKDFITQHRDKLGKRYITSTTPGSYLVTNTDDLPIYEYVGEKDGMYLKEFRGIWEMTDDYMGGPYVTYAIVNEGNSELVIIDTFVYAAGKDKRNYVQQLEYIVKRKP